MINHLTNVGPSKRAYELVFLQPHYSHVRAKQIAEKTGMDVRAIELYLKLLKYEWSILDATYSNWKNKLTFTTITTIPPFYGINHGKDITKFYSR